MTSSPLIFDTQRLADWSAGTWDRAVEQSIDRIVHDSRQARPGSLYIAIQGERLDGHDFISDVHSRGATAALVAEGFALPEGIDLPLLRVADTRKALKDLAREYRKTVGTLVVGITGSAGKTTVKDMIADVLETQGRTSRTPGNWNNDIGLPLSLLAMQPRSEFGVYEVGTNHPGEIGELCDILQPLCGVITSVGSSHIGHFGSVDAIADEKAALLRSLPSEGVAILDRDDERFAYFSSQTEARIVTVSRKGDADYVMHVDDVGDGGSTRVVEQASGLTYTINLPLPGEHVRQNALKALAVAREFGVKPEAVVQALEAFEAGSMRWQEEEAGGFRLINDAYNANPLSMSAALSAFAEMDVGSAGKWLVLGGMHELGTFEDDAHAALGVEATAGDWAGVCFVGPFAKKIAAGAADNQCIICEDNAAVVAQLQALAAPGDTILLKGSRAEHLEHIIDLLK